MSAALRAEWVKLRSLPGTLWLVLGIAAATAGTSAVSVAAAHCGGAACGQDPGKISLIGVELGQAVVAILAVLCATGEYGTGMIRVTLAALPHRWSVLAAKAALVSLLVLAAGVAGIAASFAVARVVLPGHGFAASALTSGAMVRAYLGSVLYLALVGVLAVGVGFVLRDGAVSIGAALGLLYLFPVLGAAFGPNWQRHLDQISPMMAGLDVQATVSLRTLPLTPWQGLGVLALWSCGALLLGGVVLRMRDALPPGHRSRLANPGSLTRLTDPSQLARQPGLAEPAGLPVPAEPAGPAGLPGPDRVPRNIAAWRKSACLHKQASFR